MIPSSILPTRRRFLAQSGLGFGSLALASMLQDEARAATVANPLALRPALFAPKAKSVIWLFMTGAPSQVDTWDPKPELAKFADKTLPGLNGLSFPSPFAFEKSGKSGIEVSERVLERETDGGGQEGARRQQLPRLDAELLQEGQQQEEVNDGLDDVADDLWQRPTQPMAEEPVNDDEDDAPSHREEQQ